MTDKTAAPEARTASGVLRGRWEGGVALFRGVPYAAAPVGDRRFAPPAPAPSWTGVRDAVEHGTIAPQPPSRLNMVMGDFSRPQSEDCLTLTIATPAPDDARRPVLVWLHGGAYLSGAGSLDWYSGATFARTAGIVAVGVNYRLGALGFLRLPGVSPGNLGLMDQIAALRWVRENIAAFGGDPEQVTVAGQSAGAHAIAYLMAMPSTEGLFRRAILQSAPLGRRPAGAEKTTRVADRLLDALGIAASEAARLRDVPAEQIIAAQVEVMKAEHRFAGVEPPFVPAIDGDLIPGDFMPVLARGAASKIDVMVGTTREESAAFLAFDPEAKAVTRAQVEARATALLGPDASVHLDELARMRPIATPYALLTDLITESTFRRPSLQLAEYRAAHGRPAYVYQFDWQSPMPRLAACHCLEIPFMFDNAEAWPNSPMLKGADPAEIAALSRTMNGAWAAFIRTGDPNHDGLPRWRPYEPQRRETMRFDVVVGPVGDPAGIAWRRPWPERRA
ncbi:MAG TPA: carboxylesterase/lipase family protein [Alphaproteobacteria bacterium]